MGQRSLMIKIQRFLYTVIKFKVVNQAILSSGSLPSLMLFVCTDYHHSIDSFKEITQYCIVNSVRRPLYRGF